MKIGTLAKKRGETLVTVLVAAVILAVVLFSFQALLLRIKVRTAAQSERLIADFYVADLLETFRAMPPRLLLAKLSFNPVTGSVNNANLYPLCSHINILDRANAKVVQRDNFAEMPASWLDWPNTITSGTSSFSTITNRYYQVFVVDATTLQIVPSYCSRTGQSVLVPGPFLAETEKLMVTVGVTWVPKRVGISSLTQGDVARVVGSVILPGPN